MTTHAVVVDHRGREYQVHIAPQLGHEEDEDPKPHMHVQDLRGGAGKVLSLDNPFAVELSAAHATIREIGGESKGSRARREQRAQEEQDARDRETSRFSPPPAPW